MVEDGVTAMCLLLSRGNEHCYGLLTFMSMQSYHIIGHKKDPLCQESKPGKEEGR